MAKALTIPNKPHPSDKDAKQLVEAAGHAYDNRGADQLFEEAMAAAREYEGVFGEEQTRSE
jgi:hypothetical protein